MEDSMAENKELLEQVNTIRNLIVLLLIRLEVKGGEIAKVLGVSQGQLSKMLHPKKYTGKLRKHKR